MQEIEFILYVANQERSTTFYHHLLKLVPLTNVEGLTEFQLMPEVKLGLMPVKNVAKVLKSKMPHPSEGDGIPRCELYLKVPSAEKFLQRAIELGVSSLVKLNRETGETLWVILQIWTDTLLRLPRGRKTFCNNSDNRICSINIFSLYFYTKHIGTLITLTVLKCLVFFGAFNYYQSPT